MFQLTCRTLDDERWIEIEVSRADGDHNPDQILRAAEFRCQLVDAGRNSLPGWEDSVLAGANAAFRKMRIAPLPWRLESLRGRVNSGDMTTLADATTKAILDLFGGSNVVFGTPPGWEFQADHHALAHNASSSQSAHSSAGVEFDAGRPPVHQSVIIPKLGRFHFKRAETDEELEQVHRLNYRTFVKEIQQHTDTGEGRLVDKFHEWNTYFLAICGEKVIGMLSVHDRSPFSVESRMSNPSVIKKPGMRPLEVRLLAIEQAERNGPVLVGLTYVMNYFARENGYTHYLISAVAEQIPLYEHLGFSTLGPAVGKPGAMFAPMMATLEDVDARMQRTMALWERRAAREKAMSANADVS